MSAPELLYQLKEVNLFQLSITEKLILEIEFFIQACGELKRVFKGQSKFKIEMEDTMLNNNLLQDVINDILITGEYSISGIAIYTQTPEDVIYDIISGKIKEPSFSLAKKILYLHQSVRPNLYRGIIKQIIDKHMDVRTVYS